MYIEDISIVNFKNLKSVQMNFSPRLNCLIGMNGAGKTNLLDAIYYLSFCKSFFNSSDLYNIAHDENFFMLIGNYSRFATREIISCGLKKGQKKQFKRNTKVYKRLMEHIGLLPLVMITPSDTSLILGGSDERRKFMDGVISQYNQDYLNHLLKYNRALLQRNNLLKQFTVNNYFDKELLNIWNEQLIEHGSMIHKERENFIEDLEPVFQRYYSYISQDNEKVGLRHQSDLYEKKLSELLVESTDKDRIVQYTTTGIHKDDLVFNIGDFLIKKVGSQGQKKTFLIALKLAQYNFIKEISGINPILLLDDIFDRLDRERVEQIVKVVSGDNFGQIFITDTNREHIDSIIKKMDTDFRLINVKKGTVEPIEYEKK